MTTANPQAALWQPGYLLELDKLVQAAADSALGALDPQIEADIAGIRFIGACRRLRKQLTPFDRHDADRPETWPSQADAGLLFALLRLLSVLEKLEPPAEIVSWGRRRKNKRWFDGGEAASNLKEQRPTVERLHKTADEVHQLVNNLLVRPLSGPTRPATLASGQTVQPRLVLESQTLTITLDGIPHGPLEPTDFYLVKALSEAQAPLSASALQRLIPGCKGDEKTLRRHIANLPTAIRNCIQAKPGSGRWWQLPAPK